MRQVARCGLPAVQYGNKCSILVARYAQATPVNKAATAFLFELIARLQACATVPMIDIRAYAKWLVSKS
jgi:hypothetical protein